MIPLTIIFTKSADKHVESRGVAERGVVEIFRDRH